jgi:hypothetical protein
VGHKAWLEVALMPIPIRSIRPASAGRLVLLGATLLAAPGLLAGCASSSKAASLPDTWDGLQRRPSSELNGVWVRPNVEFKAYKSVRLDPVQVEFDKGWNPNQGVKSASRRISQEQIKEIREGLAKGFQKALGDALAQGGYPLVEEDGEETLRVGAGLVNVYINAPPRDDAGPTRTYVVDAGEMTMAMELRDSVTGQLLARVVDTAHGQELQGLQWATGSGNAFEAAQAFKAWAQALRRGLDTVNGKAAAR